jgi:hypothetical protein
MTLKDLEFSLELNGVMSSDIEQILAMSKKNGIICEAIDDELVKLGYDKIFDGQNEDSWNSDDDDFGYVEKFPPRHKFLEDY